MRICFAGGFGHWSHAADTKEEIAAVLVSDEDCADYREFCKGKKQYDDYREMIDKEDPDAVVADGTFDTHYPMALYAAERGIHVFCEKPVCLRLCQCDSLIEASEKTGALIYGMFTTRCEPPFYTAKKLVDGGLIGNVLLINGQKTYKLGTREPFYYQPTRFGNTFSWVGIHSVEQAMWITGKSLTDHKYFAEKSSAVNLDDRAVAICRLEDCLCTFTVDYLRPEGCDTHGDDRLRLVGTKGSLEIIGGKLYHTANGKTACELPLVTPPKIFDDFIAAAKGEREGLATTRSTVEATRAVLAITGLN